MKHDGLKIISLFLLSSLLFAITACGTVKRGSYQKKEPVDPPAKASEPVSHETTITASTGATELIRERQDILQLAYNDWKGIPYILGGTGYNGIDCSAFMQVVYEDYFSVILPRTTLEQLEFGAPVSKRSITPGDMVFFKTGRRTYHVGIMVNSTEFLHASTSEGVTISELTHPYWDSSLLAFRRILNEKTTDS
jgi:cell wall-associated NlpC family hydrolase